MTSTFTQRQKRYKLVELQPSDASVFASACMRRACEVGAGTLRSHVPRASLTSIRSHQSIVLNIPEERPFRIVVVSDTHGVIHPNTARLVRELGADHLLHGGDIGNLEVLSELAQMAPLTAVRGNIDGQITEVPESVDIDVRSGARTSLRMLLMHIAVYGPKVRADAWRLAQK